MTKKAISSGRCHQTCRIGFGKNRSGSHLLNPDQSNRKTTSPIPIGNHRSKCFWFNFGQCFERVEYFLDRDEPLFVLQGFSIHKFTLSENVLTRISDLAVVRLPIRSVVTR